MRVIRIQVRCPSSRPDISELLPLPDDETRLVVEATVGVALLELCGALWVDGVWVEDEKDEPDYLSPFSGEA